MTLKDVEKTYVKALKPELRKAIVSGEPERAASFAKALAKVYRKTQQATAKARGASA